jgi:hypothetical protein
MKLVDVPDGPAGEWVATYQDRGDGLYWLLTTDGKLHNVGPDAAGNWVANRGEPIVFCRDGTTFRPADELISAPDLESDSIVLEFAARRLRSGRTLDLADEARVELARRRLAGVAA